MSAEEGVAGTQTLCARRWEVPPEPPADWTATIVAAVGIAAPIARLLHARGLRTPQEAAAFLDPPAPPDPVLLPGMPAAVARLSAARTRGEGVLVFGDYDCDGVCSAALAVTALRALGLRVEVHLPTRADGYGLRPDTLPALAAARGCSLVLAVDNGATAADAVAAASASGVDVVIADHHQCEAGGLPGAAALVNPLLDAGGPWDGLAGVGVAWCVARALAAALGQSLPPLEDLVAVGTIADVAPLAGPNRALCRAGLAALAAGRGRPGLRALLRLARAGRPGAPTARDLSHGVAPRLNAPGRLDDPRPAYDLLMAGDEAEALAALAVVEDCNRRRQERSAELLAAAEEMAAAQGGGRALVLADPRWPPGLVGPAAARLAERYGIPVLLAGVDPGGVCRGSGRGPAGWDLTGALRRCRDLLVRFGGHAQAAGFEVAAARLPALRDALASLAPEAGAGGGEPAWALDGELRPGDLSLELARGLEPLRPWGEGNAPPAFLLRDVRVEGPPRVLGRDGGHLRLRLRPTGGGEPVPAFAAGLGAWAEGLAAGGPFDLVVRPEVDRYRGGEALQLTVSDLAPSDGDWRPFVAGARRSLYRRHPDRDALADAFRRLRALAREGTLPPEPDLVRRLLPDPGAARAALAVFREVGLLDAAGRIRSPAGGGKVDLDRSPRYRMAVQAHRTLGRLAGEG